MSKTVIELQNIKRNFQVGDETVHALRGVSFSINEGEFVTIMGTSGSGKSTLLRCINKLEAISSAVWTHPQQASICWTGFPYAP